MTQDMTKENKPFVMATLSGVAYKEPEEASETFFSHLNLPLLFLGLLLQTFHSKE